MTRDMTVVHVITSLGAGGAERLLLDLVGTRRHDGIRHVVASMIPGGSLVGEYRARGVEMHDLGMQRGWPAPGAIHRLARLLDTEKADVIHTWMYHANLLGSAAARWARCRPGVVWSLHAAEADFSVYRQLTRMTMRVGALLSRHPDVVLVNTESTRGVHERLGFRPRKWRLVYNGVDIDRFQRSGDARASVGAELELSPDARLVGLFARWDPMKDHGTFLRAAGLVAAANRSAHFLLAGEGIHDGNQELMRLARQVPALQGRMHLLGLRHDMPRLNSALDVACVSSAAGESFCLSAAEAMACEVPCVVTDVTFLPTLVGETGRVVPTRAPAAFADAVEDLLRGPAEGLRVQGARARDRIVETFSLAAMVAGYQKIYREVVDARAGAAADPISNKEAIN